MAESFERINFGAEMDVDSVMGNELDYISNEFDVDVSHLFDGEEVNKTDLQETRRPKIQKTTPDNYQTASRDSCDYAQTPIPDVEPQKQLLWALKNERYDEFVNILKNPEVDRRFRYTKPEYTDYGTCIEIASRLPDRGIFVKALLESGVKPNVQEIHPEPIHYAAKEGNPDALQVLLQDKRTKINAVDSSDRTALHHAVKYSKKGRDEKYNQCIILLLKCPDLDINKPNKKGYTAVHEAANSKKEAVELFLKYRPYDLDLDLRRVSGRTAREFILIKYPELKGLLPDTRQNKLSSDINTQLLWFLQHRRSKDFTEILQQVDNDGSAKVDPNFYYGNPHNATCLEIACKEDDCAEFVKQLLKAGADPNTLNTVTKQTPLHSAAELGNHNVLSILLEDRRTNVNAVDSDGKTVLHVIAQCDQDTKEKENILKCLELILQKRKVKKEEQFAMQVNVRDNCGQTAAQIALERRNKEFLERMLKYAGQRMDLDAPLSSRNEKLSDAIKKMFPDLKTTFPLHRDISINDLSTNLFQLLYNKRTEEFIEKLKTIDKNENIDVDDGNYTLLQYASRHCLKEPVKELLKAGADPNGTTEFEKRPPIIIASVKKNREVVRLILETAHGEKLDINSQDAKGNTALHYASKNGDLDCVVDLMSHGANFRHKNVFDKPPLPANSVKCFLDNSLKTNDEYPEDEKYELIFDYTFLLAHREQNLEPYPPHEVKQPLLSDAESNDVRVVPHDTSSPEMDFLFYMSTSKEHRKLMEHPIITSFLHIKWHRVKMVFYINLAIYTLFVLLLNAFVILDPKRDDENDMVSSSFREIFCHTARACLFIFLMYFTIRELCQLTLSPKVYIRNFENFLDFGLIFFTGWILSVRLIPTYLVVIVILLSWSELILLTGRLPELSINIEMLKTVSKNYCWFLLSYVFLIIAFAFSFYSLLRKSAEEEERKNKENNSTSETEVNYGFYTTPWLAILKTFVMMMGEFDVNSILLQMKVSENNVTGFLLFSLFVFLIAMVLLNLLTGLAVSDTQTIKANAYQLSLISRIRLIYEIEKNVLQWHRFGENCKSCRLIRPFLCLHNFFRDISLFPTVSNNKRLIHVLPNKGAEIIGLFVGETKYNCKMDLEILRESLEIISNNKDDAFIIKQTLQNIQETTIGNHEKLLARLNGIDEKLRQSENDKQELEKVLARLKSINEKLRKSDNDKQGLEKVLARLNSMDETLKQSEK